MARNPVLAVGACCISPFWLRWTLYYHTVATIEAGLNDYVYTLKKQ